jgi:hypothetical protein
MSNIFPPIKGKDGKEYSWGRMIRFVAGLGIIGYTLVKGPTDIGTTIFIVQLGVGGMLLDPKLVKQAFTFWKSRNG